MKEKGNCMRALTVGYTPMALASDDCAFSLTAAYLLTARRARSFTSMECLMWYTLAWRCAVVRPRCSSVMRSSTTPAGGVREMGVRGQEDRMRMEARQEKEHVHITLTRSAYHTNIHQTYAHTSAHYHCEHTAMVQLAADDRVGEKLLMIAIRVKQTLEFGLSDAPMMNENQRCEGERKKK